MEKYERRVLEALVSGFKAREGMKERFRALTEYEIARRLGVTAYSFVEYESCSERAQVRQALDELSARGLVSRATPSGRYDSFVPGPSPNEAEPREGEPTAERPTTEDSPGLVDRQLQEIIELLRSIDRKLDSTN